MLEQERKIGAAKRLTALCSCAEHAELMRELHNSKRIFRREEYRRVQARIAELGMALQEAQYELLKRSVQKTLTPELKTDLLRRTQRLRRSLGQYNRTLEHMEAAYNIKPPLSAASPTPETQIQTWSNIKSAPPSTITDAGIVYTLKAPLILPDAELAESEQERKEAK